MGSWNDITKTIHDWLDDNSDQLGVLLWQVETDAMPGYDTSSKFHKSSKGAQPIKDEDVEKLAGKIVSTIQSNFNIEPIKNIGTGSLGVAYLVNSNYGKVVFKLTMDEKEAKVAGCLANTEGHPNVIKIYEVAKISKVGLYVILEEYGGEPLSISDKLGKLIDYLWYEENRSGKASYRFEDLKNSGVPGAKEIYSAYKWLNKACDFEWEDLHAGNIVKNGSIYKIIDIGNTNPGVGAYKELSLLEGALNEIILIKRIDLI